jgi:TFIIF-interacting CTD phosphatase-like protein
MPEGKVYIKDLDLLNRDLRSTIIVDNLKENFMYHHLNGIEIASWYDDFGDRCLHNLGGVL